VFTRVEHTDAGAAPRAARTPVGGMPTGRSAEILALFAQRPELSAADVAEATGLGRAMVRRYLAELVAEGRLAATAPPASRNRTYRLQPG
jgi:DNA-binding IclR family transcriptional regulator